MNFGKEIKIVVDRDSVCAGDDCDPHVQSFPVSAATTIGDFLQLIERSHYLASIQGGKATWLIDCASNKERRCIGVIAQQWAAPKLLVPPNTLLVDLLAGPELKLHFRYWAQADPATVFACVQSGQELPSR